MKDLELKDILAKGRVGYNKVSLYLNGKWQFAPLGNPVITNESQTFFRVATPFGLVKSTETNPAKYTVLGNPGDYVALDQLGEVALVTKEQFKTLFPRKNTYPKQKPTTSSVLKDPNYITKIVRES